MPEELGWVDVDALRKHMVKRSLVRVKIWSLLGTFFTCAGFIKFGHLSETVENVVLGIAVISPI